jgi:hypothetical protein
MSTRKNPKDPGQEQIDKFLQNNYLFGEAIDKTRNYTDRRFDKNPRIKTNIENGNRFLDKAKFLTKFSCFDGYMQYVDTHWKDPLCHGVDFDDFKKSLSLHFSNRQSMRTSFYNNYLTEETLVKTIDCGGYLE